MSYPMKNSNKLWPQYLAAAAALMAIFCSGIHMGWTSPSIPRLFTEEYPFEVSKEEASYIAIIGPVGDVIGYIACSILMDLIGRKWTILLIGVPQIVSMAMIYLSSHSIVLLYVARLIGGISEGACYTVLPLYVCEVSEPRIRGILGCSFSLLFIMGILIANLVGSFATIYTAALIYLTCSVLFMVCFSPMPESPYFLIMRNRTEAAEASLRKLRACDDVKTELASLISDVQRQMSEKGRYKDLIAIPSNRMAIIVMTILRFLQQFCGVSSFTVYTQMLFKEATDAIPEQWAATLMLIIQAVATLVAVSVVDILGRKPMILISVGGCCLTLTFNAIFFALRDLTDLDVSDLGALPLTGLILFIVSFAMGLGSAVNLMLGELFPASVKAKAACMMNMIFAVGMIVSTKFYQVMVDNFYVMIPFATFAVIQLLGFILCWIYVPETKNKTLEEIQQELKGKKNEKISGT